MKIYNKMLLFATLFISVMAFSSCSEKSTDEPVVPQLLDLGDGSTAYEIKGNVTLKYPNTYNLKGFVYVTDGAVLTIEPGVIIKGEKASKSTLIVERGGKVIAQGTKDLPIVFTSAQPAGSRNPGDWGGVILLGKAPNNQGEMTIEGGVRSKHGGTDPLDNSGVISYVRIEFAGVEYAVDNEINGLTLGSVGSGTKIDHVQVSYSGDDSFEWFGGTVNATNLVAFRGWDDDFDTDNGFQGKLQFGVGLRDPKRGDKSSSNGFESDNMSTGAQSEPRTRPIFANFSMFGPVSNPANYVDSANVTGSATGLFQAGVQIRRSSQLNLFNSVVVGYPVGVIVENDKSGSNSQESFTSGLGNLNGNVLAGAVKSYQDLAANKKPVDNGVASVFVKAYWEDAARTNSTLSLLSDLKFQGNPQLLSAPNFCPSATSPLATGAVWTHANVASGFNKVAYRGAFAPTETATNNWTTGWCEFNPQNKVY